jgi:hypothetical protein
MKKCRECGEQIPESARKCSKCDAYQDWRHIFGFGTTTLSLLVALFSVLTVAVPVLERAFTPTYEAVTVRVVAQRFEPSLQKNVLVILLANGGTVKAFVSPNATLFANKRRGAYGVDMLPTAPQGGANGSTTSDLANLLVGPSDQRMLFAAHPESAPALANSDANDTCELVISVYRIDGIKREDTHKYPCFNPGLIAS